MKSRAKETTAEWIGDQLIAIIGSYPKERIAGTMPVILLYMVREFGFDSLQEPVRASVLRVLDRAGAREGMEESEIVARVEAYLDSLDVDEELLRSVHEVFRAHHAALAEAAREELRSIEGLKKPRVLPLRVGEKPPPGTLGTQHFRARVR